MNLQLLANTRRFLQPSLLAASVLRLKDAPAIRLQAGVKGPQRHRLASARTPGGPSVITYDRTGELAEGFREREDPD